MTNLLSAVSGHFGKALILGTLLPVIVFALLSGILVAQLLPADLWVLKTFTDLGPEWKLAAVGFAILLMAGLLFNLNIPLIRFYEGYPWKESWIGQWLVKRAQTQFDALRVRWDGMRTLYYALPENDEKRSEILNPWAKVGLLVNRSFPDRRDLVLPTRLGNVIRSFERYPYVQYGMESVILWPRLIGVMDKEYEAAIDEAKTSFDFTLNCSALSAATGLCILLAGLFHPVVFASPERSIEWLAEVVGFLTFSYWFYKTSIGRATAWGEMIKGGFDLYRDALLHKLGYKRTFTTRIEERRVWDLISKQVLFGDSPRLEPPTYLTIGTFAHCGEPSLLELKVGRGVAWSEDAEMVITIRVQNGDSKRRSAKKVKVVDTLPEDFDYGWGSAAVSDRKVEVSGSNPYEFALGDLAFDQAMDLTYRAIPRSRKEGDAMSLFRDAFFHAAAPKPQEEPRNPGAEVPGEPGTRPGRSD